MATPLRRHPKDRVPTSRISSRHPDGPGRRRLLRSPNTKHDNLGRPDVDRGQGPENQRSLYRGRSSPKLDGNRSEPKHVFWERSHTEKKLSIPGAVQESDRSTTHRDARKTDVPRTGPRLFTEIRRSLEGTLLVPGRGSETRNHGMEETMYQRIRGRSIGRHADRSNDPSGRHRLRLNGYARRRYTFRPNGYARRRYTFRPNGYARRRYTFRSNGHV